jgi:riboflavin biosynthesis pyrimidine reductase
VTNGKTESPDLLDWYRLDNTVSANFVVSTDGRYKDEQGSSRGISSAVDLAHLVHLRRQCDALITDGTTARLESYKPSDQRATYVFTRREVAPGLTALMANESEGFVKIFERLEDAHDRILLETGPRLLKEFIRLGLVDSVFISVTGEASKVASGLSYATSLLGFTCSPVKSHQYSDTSLNRFDLN